MVYRIQGIPVTQQEIQAGVALRVENGETVKTAKKEVIKDIITKKTLYALAKKNGCTVSDQEYDDYAKLLKTQMNKAENRKEIRDFMRDSLERVLTGRIWSRLFVRILQCASI